jgi:hypothetical protein
MRSLSRANAGRAARAIAKRTQKIAGMTTRQTIADVTPDSLNSSRFGISRLDPLIERLQHPRIHRCDHVHRCVQFFFGHSRFPRVREATVDSRIAEPHHCNGETDQHLFALGETFDGVRVAVEGSKVGFLGCHDVPF